MKTFLAALALAAAAGLAAHAQEHKQHNPQHPHDSKGGQHEGGEKMSADEALKAGGGRIRRGAALGTSTPVAFADVLKEPAKFAGKKVVVEGVVERVCQAEGCWMQIAPGKDGGDAAAVRVTFDHKFAVPKEAAKMNFRAEGVFSVKTLSKEAVEHLVREDGAKIKTNPDGTAHELSFVATGVELWK